MKINKKCQDRISSNISRYKKVLQKAKDRDVNESDTVSIIVDMLEDVFGYNKYDEVTSEYAIKSTFCDLAIVLDGNLKILIEVKAIGLNLKENHLNQVLAYGAKEGLDWVILTNGIIWEAYQINMKDKLEAHLLFRVDFLEFSMKQKELLEYLFVISKEAQSKNAMAELKSRLSLINRHTISAILTEDTIINSIRLQVNKISKDVKATNEDIYDVVFNEIIKRDIIEDDIYKKTKTRLKRLNSKK